MDAELAQAIKASLTSYTQVRDKYYEDVFAAVFSYLDGDGAVTKFRNDMSRAMVNAFSPAAEMGWEDGGGTLPIDDEALNAWVTAMIDSELAHIEILFQTLKETRKGEDVQKVDVAQARADGYTQTLDEIYNRAKISAGKNIMLTMVGEDGQPPHYPCPECRKYKNKRHRASWWIEHDAIPGSKTGYTCKGYNCRHVLVSDDGQVWTL